ncbi:uncharacterized protein ACRADG_005173 [Cochliomyia hominivorax]
MTDLRRSVDSSRFQQKQNSHESTYRSSCSSTPEPQKHNKSNTNVGYRKPLLHNLIDHPNMSSTSGGSTTSTTNTTNTIGRSSSYAHENGNITSSTAEIQFDEREIYYVSPTKRKNSLSASQTPVLRSSLRACERLRSFSPTSAAAIAPTYPPIMPSAAYGARLSGTAGHDLSFDNYDASSHYSDTAMQVLRSGSCSAMTSMLNTNNLINNSTSTTANNFHSSSSSLAQQQHPQQQQQLPSQQTHLPPGQRLQNNVVTFSNHISEQRAATPQNRGSLRRTKGRSNQSLCSCDVGNDTELNPDPTRPLYEYSLERRHKAHTYTCEQNAQILLRLERERNRKLSLGGGSLGGTGGSREDLESDALSSSDTETIPPVPPPPAMKRNGSVRSLRLLQHLQQQQQQQQQQQSTIRSGVVCNGNQVINSSNKSHHNSSSNSNNNNNNNNNSNGSIATLCSGDLLNDCAKSTHDVRAVIDDCTSSILKCANAMGSDIMSNTSTTTNGSYKTQVSTLNTMVSHSKPDVCHITNTSTNKSLSYFGNFPPPYAIQDDIVLPKSQKSDPSLCFLHKASAMSGMSHVVAPPSSSASMAFTDFTQSQRDLQQKLQHYKNSSRLSLSKYNTIGPSSDYARQLAVYAQQQQQLQHQQQQQQQHLTHIKPFNERCRCFSKSWSNFSRDLMQTQCSNNATASTYHTSNHDDNHSSLLHQQQSNFHATVTSGSSGKGRQQEKIPLRSSLSSRSFNNLVDIDTYNYDMASILSSHHKLHLTQQNTHQLATSNGGGVGNSVVGGIGGIVLSQSNSSSGLKDNHMHGQASLKHQHQQHQLLQHHYQQQQHKDFHCDEHDNHHPLGMHGSTHLIKSSEKFHQHNHHHNHNNTNNHHPPHHSSLTSIMPWKHRHSPSRGSSSSGTNSFRFDAAKHWLAVSSILLIIGAASVAVPLALRVAASAPFEERLRVALQLLDQVPLIDGHNDLPWNIRKFLHNKLNDFNFNEDLREVLPWKRSHWSHTDLTRLKKGRISAQFWAAYVPCEAQHRDAVQLTLEQIDVIKRLTDRYSPQLTTCTSAQDIIEAHKNHQLCSLTGVEGGHSLGGSLAVLRTLYAIGVRYMTLTSTCHTPWADSSYADAPTYNVKHGGLTIFGKTIIREMNRLGMMVDLSHVSTGTMRDALEVSEAPVIFSHSSAYELCNSSRNVQDDMLQSLAKNGGIIMVNFYSRFLSCSENSTVHDAVAHINHIKRVAGIDHVGLGAGYDGINFTPKGLEDVSSYPTLFAELLGVGWSIEDLTKLAGGNFLRVMQQVEKVRDEKKAGGVKPYEDHPNFRAEDPYNCTSS